MSTSLKLSTFRDGVAIKVVRGEVVINAQANQNALRLFTREMKAIAALDHLYILSIIDFGEEIAATGTITYLVMPYRPEGSLVDRLRRQSEQGTPPHALAEIVKLIQQAASALQHAHDHYTLHLDVKSSNFLVRELTENPRVPDLLLADFGISRFTMATSSTSQSVRGTPTSMAPEHWEGKPVAASDQYGLAIMTYQLLTGTLPFTGTMQQVMFQQFSTPVLATWVIRSEHRLFRGIDARYLLVISSKWLQSRGVAFVLFTDLS